MKQNALKTSIAIGLAVAAVLMLLASAGFLLAAVYIQSAALWGDAVAALVASGVSLLFTGLFLWLTLRMNR